MPRQFAGGDRAKRPVPVFALYRPDQWARAALTRVTSPATATGNDIADR